MKSITLLAIAVAVAPVVLAAGPKAPSGEYLDISTQQVSAYWNGSASTPAGGIDRDGGFAGPLPESPKWSCTPGDDATIRSCGNCDYATGDELARALRSQPSTWRDPTAQNRFGRCMSVDATTGASVLYRADVALRFPQGGDWWLQTSVGYYRWSGTQIAREVLSEEECLNAAVIYCATGPRSADVTPGITEFNPDYWCFDITLYTEHAPNPNFFDFGVGCNFET